MIGKVYRPTQGCCWWAGASRRRRARGFPVLLGRPSSGPSTATYRGTRPVAGQRPVQASDVACKKQQLLMNFSIVLHSDGDFCTLSDG